MKNTKRLILFLFIIFSFCITQLNLNAQEDYFSHYQYRAWGIGGDENNSKIKVAIDDEIYTILAFSKEDIARLDTSTGGDVTTILISLEKNSASKKLQLTVSQDYLNKALILKVYSANGTFIGNSYEHYLQNSGTYIDFGTITIKSER